MFKKMAGFFWNRFAFNNLVSGNYEKAEKYFRKLYRQDSDRLGVRYNLALSRLAQKDYTEAETLFQEEIQCFGKNTERLKALGDLYWLRGERDAAADYYQQTLEHDPSGSYRHLLNARLTKCRDKTQFANAQEGLKHYEHGDLLLNANDLDQAFEEYLTAADLDDSNFQAFNNLGTILLNHRKQPAEAIPWFEKALALTSLPTLQNNLRKAQDDLAGRNKHDTGQRTSGSQPHFPGRLGTGRSLPDDY